MDNLEKLIKEFHESLNRPFCSKCQLSRVDGNGQLCDHCETMKHKKAESLRAFLASRTVDRVVSVDPPAYPADVQEFTGRLF